MAQADAGFAHRIAKLRELLAPSLAEDWPNLPVVRGEGVYLIGLDGRRYVDFVSGMAACNLGHCHPRVVEAARQQLEVLIHGPIGVALYDPVLQLSEELAAVTPGGLDMFFWSNSGAEAVEGALKLARYVTRRPAIISFVGGFHGRTLGAASVTTSNVKYRHGYEPLLPSVYHLPFPYCYRCPFRTSGGCCGDSFHSLERLFRHVVAPEDVAAIIVEPILGEGGYIVPPADFLPRLRAVCDRYGILLILDEIQTGFGRTGALFAADAFGVRPDILVLSKALASGFPLSVVAARRELMGQWPAGAHGTTFGGNPVACAAALATLQVLRNEPVLENVRQRSEEAMSALTDLQRRSAFIGDVRGRGLMIGVEFVDPERDGAPHGEIVRRILNEALRRGLLLYPAGYAGHVLRIIPPLIITKDELAAGLAILSEVVTELSR
ncbi:MAG: aspartate aminotransferase family protein [Armatimonadota bacterium]|nr:aspartate aminotransferase family protein [Armatimonadota bacterium]MDR7438172.1 aspartate aminotransferase family protein [Armatimonadota bacterium]MDR7472202.1 aspartate aminotransferase family protein [Armatimonadota bacterium]MDR7507702.1 aspartate aminotransferase family protein [Armatimonadota bacterium]MDR7559678.1 aspartate aminotransferase family protein [Armatimonadota bacterium]